MVGTAIFRGYNEEGEVWAIGKIYGSNETETSFICEVEPTPELIEEYERRKNVFSDSRKKKRGFGGHFVHPWKKSLDI